MVYLNVWLTVKDRQNIERVGEWLGELARLSRAEPGCARFEVYHSSEDESRFLLHEHWESQAALDTHRRGRAFTELYQPNVLPLVVREAHPSRLLE